MLLEAYRHSQTNPPSGIMAELERHVKSRVPVMTPSEITFLLSRFYNANFNLGFSSGLQETLESQVRTDVPEMNSEELAQVYSSFS